MALNNSERYQLLLQRKPWYESWKSAKRRCEDVNHKSYRRYGGRGIQFLLTKDQVSFLWVRDNAGAMDRPRLDRIDVDKHYEIGNCRFITEAENIARMHENAAAPAEWTD